MAVRDEKLHAKTVDRAKEGAIESCQEIGRRALFENTLARALLHFVRGAVGEGDHHQPWQPFRSLPRNLYDPFRDRCRFARPGGGDHGKIPLQFRDETVALRLILRERFHSSLLWRTPDACTPI